MGFINYRGLVRLIVVLRVIFAALIFYSVWISALFTFILDWIDGEIFKRAGYHKRFYNHWDKLLDYYWYIWIIIYLYRIQTPQLLIFFILFIYRTVGYVSYLLLNDRRIFFIFPNFFEMWFYFYLSTTLIPSWERYLHYPLVLIPAVITVVFVIVREYIAHIKQYYILGIIKRQERYWQDSEIEDSN